MNEVLFSFARRIDSAHHRIAALILLGLLLLIPGPAPALAAGISSQSQTTGLWKRQTPGAPLGLAYSGDGRHYVAYLRPLTCNAGQNNEISNWVCRIRFTLYDTSPPGPKAFIVAPASIARPMGVSQGRGDWDGYAPAHYDKGAITDGQAHVLKAGGEWFTLIDWRVRWMENNKPRQTTNSSLFSLLPANKEQAESISRSLGLRGDTPEWLAFTTLLGELQQDRYHLATLKDANSLAPAPGKVTVFLRHDVDVSLYGAQIMAFEEALHSIPATYCINISSSIYALTGEGVYVRRPGALQDLLTLQGLGHEISCRTDSRTMRRFYDTPVSAWLHAELRRMRSTGLHIVELTASASSEPAFRCISDADVGQGERLEQLIHSLRASRPGEVLQVLLHPRLWTTDTLEFDLSLQGTALHLALRR